MQRILPLSSKFTDSSSPNSGKLPRRTSSQGNSPLEHSTHRSSNSAFNSEQIDPELKHEILTIIHEMQQRDAEHKRRDEVLNEFMESDNESVLCTDDIQIMTPEEPNLETKETWQLLCCRALARCSLM